MNVICRRGGACKAACQFVRVYVSLQGVKFDVLREIPRPTEIHPVRHKQFQSRTSEYPEEELPRRPGIGL